jgi:pyruvate dehydrogenase (quinone)
VHGLADALRRDGAVSWEHVTRRRRSQRRERQRSPASWRCAWGSRGPGNLHLINGLFDASRSRVPVLAITAHIPTAEIGGG